jgi:hypothetical protein
MLSAKWTSGSSVIMSNPSLQRTVNRRAMLNDLCQLAQGL